MRNPPYDKFGNMALNNMLKTSMSNTWFGFTMSIGYLALVLAFLIYSLIELGDRHNPSSSIIEETINDPPVTNLVEQHFIFGWGLTTKSNSLEPLPSSGYYNMEASVVDYNFEKINGVSTYVKTATQIPIRPCTEKDFIETGDEFSKLFNLSLFSCLDEKNSNDSIRLQGKFGSLKAKVIEIVFEPCTSSCASDMNAELEVANMMILTAGSTVDPTNYKKPITFSSKIKQDFVNLDESKLTILHIEKRIISSDSNIVTQKFKDSVDYYIKDMETIVSSTPTMTDDFYTIQLRLVDSSIIIKRSYKKLQNVLADVNGVAVFLAAIIWTIISPYVTIKVHEKMRPQSKQHSLTFKEYIKAMMGNQAAKAKYKALKSSVDDRINLFHMIKVASEHDKLTSVLLDPDQRLLLSNLTPKRNDSERENKIPVEEKYEPINLDKDVEEAYFRLRSKSRKSEIDYKLEDIYSLSIKDCETQGKVDTNGEQLRRKSSIDSLHLEIKDD